ncbi:hybrid sensor histidine kinase/response regulator transcription factor [Aquimarina aggregata]|uniref:hybrid sensor histidine kinase/response regulator transcription factor n=1 Tax=Aquimarina aggregata TaxID=1642818 RepID=UPI00248F9C23|nr:hybrid sensor histidine kinase/response regulator transcription factor [Aquimarina aggregata]
MRRKILNTLFLFLLCFIIPVLNARQNPFSYNKKLNITNGLAHNGVTSIFEDSKGFIWFGTYEGINRYDGYELKTFKNTIDTDALTSNRVRAINEDKRGNIWIGTDEGITIYNYEKEKFEKITSDKLTAKGLNKVIIREIIINENYDLVLCITENKGLLIFNHKDYALKGHYNPKNVKAKTSFFHFLEINKSNYLIATSYGLLRFDLKSCTFNKVLEHEIQFCRSLEKLSPSKLLVTLLKGVAIIDFDDSNNLISFSLKRKSLNLHEFNSSLLDDGGNLWLGTLNNGIIFIENASSFDFNNNFGLKTFDDNISTLRSSKIISTSDNSCWYATFNEGLYRFDLRKTPFHYNTFKTNNKNDLRSNNVTHITTFDKNRVFLTSTLGGLRMFNTETQQFEQLPFKLSEKLVSKINSVYVDSKGNTWLKATEENNLIFIGCGQKTPKIINNIELFPTNDNILFRSFGEDKYGNLWVLTNTDVFKISLNKDNSIKTISSLKSHPLFKKNPSLLGPRVVFVDPLHNFIWIGTQFSGLIRINNNNNKSLLDAEIDLFVQHKFNKKSISSNFVTAIVRLPNNELWLGTEGGGICKVLYSDTNPTFIPFTEKNGLSNNVVKSILYDDNNNLWVSTNIGLNFFNTHKKEFRRFSSSNGLPFEDFWYASNKLKNGTLLFSGLDGFIYFNPNNIPSDEKLPKTRFENFKIFNKKIEPGDIINKRVLLDKAISEIDNVILKHDENVFSVDFISLHYLNPKNLTIKYRLLPFNEKWTEVSSNQKTISYNGLPSGEYKLFVSASNSLNDWTTPKVLNITIKPSIWNTKFAYLSYIFSGILLIFIIIQVILKIQRLNYKVKIEQFNKDKVREVNEAKFRFFANISHEIKTPLTLISRPIDMLSQKFKNNTDIVEKLSLIKRQSNRIEQLIEQVLDFRKADSNMLKMHYSRFSFNGFIQELVMDFYFLASNDQKKLKIIHSNTNIIVSADKNKLEKVFNNLFNNAFKFTRTGDSITLEYKQNGDKELIVTISDTGRGIDATDIDHVFKRFYQSKKTDNTHITGSGIGLAFSKRLVEMHYGFINAESELNKGTKITLRLPIVKKHLPTDILDKIILPEEKEIKFSSSIVQADTINNVTTSGEFSKSTVFYVEDNLEMRIFVSDILSKYFDVKSFRNGKECIEMIDNQWPDIVISDIQMPEMNGLDLCLKIKSDLKTSHIPVILLTALTNIEDNLQGIRDGADAYIKKPFNIQYLITNIEALLIIRKKLRERYQIGIPLTKENNKNNKNDNAFLEKLYSLIEENLDNQDFDLNNLARELYLNRTHFYQKVKVLTNKTPFELIKMYRLKKAAELLSQNGLSVNEVFIMTGFKSRTHFTKIFKEKYKISPGKYALESKKKYDQQ